jgi:hypothetical protein
VCHAADDEPYHQSVHSPNAATLDGSLTDQDRTYAESFRRRHRATKRVSGQHHQPADQRGAERYRDDADQYGYRVRPDGQ